MSNFISKAGKPTTEMTYKDRSRNRLLPMLYAEKLFTTLTAKHGDTGGEVVSMFDKLSKIIVNTPGKDMADLWPEVERKLNDRKTLSTKATNDHTKALTLMSLFYEGANLIDVEQISTTDLAALRGIFESTNSYMQMKYRSLMNSKDQRVYDNITSTISERIDAIAERFNTLVDQGQIFGAPI